MDAMETTVSQPESVNEWWDSLPEAGATVGSEYTTCAGYENWSGYNNNTLVCVGVPTVTSIVVATAGSRTATSTVDTRSTARVHSVAMASQPGMPGAGRTAPAGIDAQTGTSGTGRAAAGSVLNSRSAASGSDTRSHAVGHFRAVASSSWGGRARGDRLGGVPALMLVRSRCSGGELPIRLTLNCELGRSPVVGLATFVSLVRARTMPGRGPRGRVRHRRRRPGGCGRPRRRTPALGHRPGDRAGFG